MKRVFLILMVICLSMGLCSIVSAGPAPKLSSVQITAVGPDSSGNWVLRSNLSPLTNYDGYFYVEVKTVGYYSSYYFYRNGSIITPSKVTRYIHNPITSGSIITGYIDCFKIPMTSICTPPATVSTFCARFDSVNGGATHYDTINGIEINAK
ncbi:MAG: hypothetical protein H6Q70_2776 [Firmicutes bacterium]|nr:hypothetical protein [Bacillota bacterium]